MQEMNETMLERWNAVVRPEDDVYCLGDFAFQSRDYELEMLLAQLNGRIFYIKGNHDKEILRAGTRHGRFEWVKDYFELKVDDPEMPDGRQKICLMHFLPAHVMERRGSRVVAPPRAHPQDRNVGQAGDAERLRRTDGLRAHILRR